MISNTQYKNTISVLNALTRNLTIYMSQTFNSEFIHDFAPILEALKEHHKDALSTLNDELIALDNVSEENETTEDAEDTDKKNPN